MRETNPVGYVVGEVRTDEFTFVTNPDLAPPRLEYIVLRGVREPIGEQVREVDVLAQVASLSVNSRLLSPAMNYNEVESILRRLGASPPVVVGQAKVLGYLDGKTVRLPRGAAMPGALVERAPDELLCRFFSQDVTSGIQIGTLINRPRVEVLLDPNGLRRHLAVIAQTGAGKSYTVGVVLEKLLELGGTIVVFDPNSDYVLMGRTPERRPTSFADRVQVFRVPNEQQNRIADAEIDHTRRLTVQFANLDVDEICDVAGIAETYTNMRKAVKTAYDNLRGRDFTPQHLHDELERIAGLAGYADDGANGRSGDVFGGLVDFGPGDALGSDAPAAADGPSDGPPADPDNTSAWFGSPEERGRRQDADQTPRDRGTRGAPPGDGKPPTQDAITGAARALKHIEFLAGLKIWGFEDVPMNDLLRPMSLSTVDLAGVDRKVADFIVTKIVSEIWKQATRYGLSRPVFLVLEEAHNFVPAGHDEGKAGWWLKRIASEGRKFGIFLVLITQRPYRVHQDTLSQCGSQVIMRLTNPEDQNAVRRASESISEGLLSDLPGLNVGEAVVLGPLVRVPVMVRIGQRESQEGGSDIDVVARLEAARAEAVTEGYIGARREERAARGRSEWREEI